MCKLKAILKAFVLIVLPAFLVIGGIFAVVPVAQMCFGGISHPLMAFPSIIMMVPWGLMFIVVFFVGVGTMRTAFGVPPIALIAPIPSFVIYSHGGGAYSTSSGSGRGGGMILAIIKFVLAIPIAIIVWIVVSIILLFNSKMENRMNDAFEDFIDNLKELYKWGILLFVIFPLIVVGFNGVENNVYSPKNLQIKAVDFYYSTTDEKVFSPVDCEYHVVDYYKFTYTIDTCENDLQEIKGEWIVIDKTTGESISYDAGTFVPYNWYWKSKDKSMAYEFTTKFEVDRENEKSYEIFSKGIENIEIICKIDYISFDSNIPILGDFLLPTIDNEYKDGYLLTVKP